MSFMKKTYVMPLLAVCIFSTFSVRAIDLKQSKFTEIVNDVKVISAGDKSIAPATMDEIFKVPDVLRTGPDSRAELVADDQTVTRVGANTIFSFDPANRTIDLRQGSLLFHSPHGKGGGTIQTGSATASVLGTTIIVSTTPNGGFKVLVLEGKAKVTMSGIIQNLNAGQLIYVLPGGGISPIVTFRLDEQTRGSKLVGGFKNPLHSQDLINKAIGSQLKQIKNGKAVDTGLLAGDTATSSSVDAISAPMIQVIVNDQTPQSSSPSPTDVALQTDFTINTSILDLNNIFPAGLIGTGFNIIDPNGFLGGTGLPNPFFGFPGHNITINTPTIDLSAYALQPKFQIVAVNNLDVQSSLDFSGISSANEVDLAAGNQLTIASGSSVEADCGKFFVGGFQVGGVQPNTLDDVGLYNDGGGEMDLVSGSALTLQNSSVVFADTLSFVKGASVDFENSSAEGNSVDIESSSTLMLNNNSSADALSGSATLNAGTDLTVDSSSVSGNGGTTLSADGNILLNNASVTESSSDVSINAGNDLTVSGTTTISSSIGLVSLSALDLASLSGATITSSGAFTLSDFGSDPLTGTAVTIDNSQITGGNGVNLFSYNGSMTIQNNSQINSPNGAFDAEAESSLTVDNSTLSGTTGLGLTANNGDLTLQNGAALNSGGDINLNSGQLGVGDILINNSTASGVNVNANTINSITINNNASLTASSAVDVEAGIDLTLDTASLTGGSSSLSTLSGDNSVTVGNSSVESGSLQVSSTGGTIDVNNNSSLKSDSSDITIEANTDTTIDSSTLNSFGNLNLYADNNGLTLNGATLTAGSLASLNGKNSVNIGNSGITADNVDIESSSGAITVNNSSSVTANSGNLTMNAHADLTVDNATLTGNNNINLTSANNDLSLNNNTVTATGTATLSGKTSTTFGGGSLNANAANFQSANGTVTINSGATIAANIITLTAGDQILIDNVTMSGSLPSTPGTLTATAANTISVGQSHAVDFSGLANVSMSAKTINLYNVNFALLGIYNFNCLNGAASIGSITPGDANFISCTLNSIPLVIGDINLSGVASLLPGIHVF